MPNRPHGLQCPQSHWGTGMSESLDPSWIAGGSISRSRVNSSPSAPNTARRMTFSVMRIIEGNAANARSAGPGAEFGDGFAFDDGLVGSQPPPVERRCQQLAVRAMAPTRQREHRIGAHDTAEVGIGRVGDVGAGREELADLARVAEHDDTAEDRQVEGEGGAVAAPHDVQGGPAVGHRDRGLKRPRDRRSGRQRGCRHRRMIGGGDVSRPSGKRLVDERSRLGR